MVRILDVGSGIIISFQTKFPTFSVAEFDSTLTDLGYARLQLPSDTQTQQTGIIAYTKQDVTVDADFLKNILNFRISNTIKIETLYKEITQTLVKLHIEPNSIHLMGLKCTTRAHEVGDPEQNLTALVDKNILTQISATLDFDPGIMSIVLANRNPKDEDLQIRIEPLSTNPSETYFIMLNYRTPSHEKFNTFIGKFGPSLIEKLVEVISKNAKTD